MNLCQTVGDDFPDYYLTVLGRNNFIGDGGGISFGNSRDWGKRWGRDAGLVAGRGES